MNRRPDKRAPRDAMIDGRVVAAFGRRLQVETSDGARLDCVTRGRKRDVACGDRVLVRDMGGGQGVIEDIEPRSTLLYRSDPFRQKLIAANVDQVVFVLAGKPSFSEELLSRCLIAAEAAGVSAVIALNKADLAEETARAEEALAWTERLGYPRVRLAAKRNVEPLNPLLKGKLSVLVGQSGMGKSTIVNALVPEVPARVGEVSEALDAGRHTTSHTRLYRLADGSEIIDSPGLQEFGLFHVPDATLAWALPELRPHLGRCRFSNCRHLNEPDCAVAAAGAAGEIRAERLALYRRLVEEHAAWRARLHA